MYRYTLVGLQKIELRLRRQLPYGWQLLSQWESLEPGGHRTPLPLAVFRAMISVAIVWGLREWAAITVLAYWCPARVGEPMDAYRADLTLPHDTLLSGSHRVLLQIRKPKSRGRGPGTQHTGFAKPLECSFLAAVYSHLLPDDKLYPRSSYCYRKVWDRLTDVLQIPRGVFTPGGLRGGGAVTAYLDGRTISELQWDMRLANQETLRFYLQEVAASNSLLSLPSPARSAVRTAAQFYETVVLAASEAASTDSPP